MLHIKSKQNNPRILFTFPKYCFQKPASAPLQLNPLLPVVLSSMASNPTRHIPATSRSCPGGHDLMGADTTALSCIWAPPSTFHICPSITVATNIHHTTYILNYLVCWLCFLRLIYSSDDSEDGLQIKFIDRWIYW